MTLGETESSPAPVCGKARCDAAVTELLRRAFYDRRTVSLRVRALAVPAAVSAVCAGASGAAAPLIVAPGTAPAVASVTQVVAGSNRDSKPRNGSIVYASQRFAGQVNWLYVMGPNGARQALWAVCVTLTHQRGRLTRGGWSLRRVVWSTAFPAVGRRTSCAQTAHICAG
jgi:hypothetical protein